MDYELAKKLKDVGFPQGDYSQNFVYIDSMDGIFLDGIMEHLRDGVLRIPTLSELIDACGEGFALHMRPNNQGWKAWQINSNPREPNAANFEEVGKTKEEAVANLYIKLNEK